MVITAEATKQFLRIQRFLLYRIKHDIRGSKNITEYILIKL